MYPKVLVGLVMKVQTVSETLRLDKLAFLTAEFLQFSAIQDGEAYQVTISPQRDIFRLKSLYMYFLPFVSCSVCWKFIMESENL